MPLAAYLGRSALAVLMSAGFVSVSLAADLPRARTAAPWRTGRLAEYDSRRGLDVDPTARPASYQQPAPTPPATPSPRTGTQRQLAQSQSQQPPSSRAASDPSRSFGSTRSPQSAAPYMIGDFFGGTQLQLFFQPASRQITTSVPGYGISQVPGDPNQPVTFGLQEGGPALITSGVPGFDASGDGLADTFPVGTPPAGFEPTVNEAGTIQFNDGAIVYTEGTGAAVDGLPFRGPMVTNPNPPTDGMNPPTDGNPPPTDGMNPPTDGMNPPTDGNPPPTDTGPQNNENGPSLGNNSSANDDLDPPQAEQNTRQAILGPTAPDPSQAGDPQQQAAPDSEMKLTHTFQPQRVLINVPSPGAGGGVGRVKIGENTSPLPRDRIFHNFSYFDNVPLAGGGVNVSRFVPGFEKTLFDGVMSVEMRFPMAVTLDNQIILDGVTSSDEVKFGNLSIPVKVLLYADRTLACSMGVQIALPTADDTSVRLRNGTELVHIENEAVHLMPFVGALYTPNERLFAQAFVQIDTDTGGNPVSVLGPGGRLAGIGDLHDADLLYVDVGIGYWLFRNDAARGLTGIAPIFEVHINRSLEDQETLVSNQFRIGSQDDVSTTNLVFGANLQFGQNTGLTVAYATPVSDSIYDFDGEVRVLFNHIFGAPRSRSRAPF